MLSLDTAAYEATRPTPNWAYFGELDMFVTWGRAGVGGKHRDSDVLDVSNHEIIAADLESQFPEDISIVRSSHCMVGWTEEIFVRVYEDDKQTITDAFKACYDWQERLEEYPIADEDDYSSREYDNLIETLINCYDIPAEDAGEFAEKIGACSSHDLYQELINDAWREFQNER